MMVRGKRPALPIGGWLAPWVMGEAYTICDPYLFTIAQWLEQDGPDHREHRRHRADTDSQREHDQQGEHRVPSERAKGVAHVLQGIVDCGEPTAVAVLRT